MDEKGNLKEERLRCSKCGSASGYLRIKTYVWVCRNCGNEDSEVIA